MTFTPLIGMRSSDEISIDLREKVYKVLYQGLLEGLKNEEVAQDELYEASTYILDNLENISNKGDLSLFLDEIEKRWSMLHGSVLKVKGLQVQSEDKGKLEKIQHELLKFSS